MIRERPDLAVGLAITVVGSAAVVVLVILGLWHAAFFTMLGLVTAQNAVPLIRRTGRAASPPAQPEIQRTTRGRPDG